MTFSFLRRPKAPPCNTCPEGEESGKGSELQNKAPGGSRPQRRRRSLGLTRGETSVDCADCVDLRGQRVGEARNWRRSLALTRGETSVDCVHPKGQRGGEAGHGRRRPGDLAWRAAELATTSLPRDVWEAAEQDNLAAWGSFRDDSQIPARSQTLSNRSQRPEAAQGSPRAAQGQVFPPSLNPKPPSLGGNTAPTEGPVGCLSQASKGGCLKKSASDPLRERERVGPRHRRSTCLEGMVEGMGIGEEDMAIGGEDMAIGGEDMAIGGEVMAIGGEVMAIGGEDTARVPGGSPEAGECRGQSPGVDQFCSGLTSEQLVPHSAPLLGSESQDKWAGLVAEDASTSSPSAASDWSAPFSVERGMASSLVFVDSLDVRMRHTPGP